MLFRLAVAVENEGVIATTSPLVFAKSSWGAAPLPAREQVPLTP